MEKIRVVIAEDEAIMRDELAFLLKEYHDLEIVRCVGNGGDLISICEENQINLVFLDVHMPGVSGVEAANKIAKTGANTPLFVFITTYDEYTLDAFELEAVDYLLKPYDEARLNKTIIRIRKRFGKTSIIKQDDEANTSTISHKLLIDDGQAMVVLDTESICFAVSNNRMLEIHTQDKVLNSKLTLQELEAKLKHPSFFRPHHSYLVNLNYVALLHHGLMAQAISLCLIRIIQQSLSVERHERNY